MTLVPLGHVRWRLDQRRFRSTLAHLRGLERAPGGTAGGAKLFVQPTARAEVGIELRSTEILRATRTVRLSLSRRQASRGLNVCRSGVVLADSHGEKCDYCGLNRPVELLVSPTELLFQRENAALLASVPSPRPCVADLNSPLAISHSQPYATSPRPERAIQPRPLSSDGWPVRESA